MIEDTALELWRALELAARRYALACALALGLETDYFLRSLQRFDLCTLRMPPLDCKRRPALRLARLVLTWAPSAAREACVHPPCRPRDRSRPPSAGAAPLRAPGPLWQPVRPFAQRGARARRATPTSSRARPRLPRPPTTSCPAPPSPSAGSSTGVWCWEARLAPPDSSGWRE